MLPVKDPPTVILPVNATLLAVYPEGGTKKSALLMALPLGVATEIWPEVPLGGTAAEMLVGVAEVTAASPTLNFVRSFAATSKFVPAIVTAVPGVPIVGVKLEIVGPPLAPAATVNGLALVAVPFGVVTAIVPVVAPAGTLVTSCVDVAELTVAFVPLTVTVS